MLKKRQSLLGIKSLHNYVNVIEKVFEAFLLLLGKIDQLKDQRRAFVFYIAEVSIATLTFYE